MVRENLGEEGMKFFPWVFTIFIFILVLNLLGLIPHSFTVTSHIIVTFALRGDGVDHGHRSSASARTAPAFCSCSCPPASRSG